MTCPDCSRRTEVVKTIQIGAATHRERRCECGVTFTTTETVVATGNRRQPRVTAAGPPQQPPTPRSDGGVGGGVPSGSDPIRNSDPNPTSQGDPERGRARRKRRTTREEYPPAFEVEWTQTAKTGAKDKACDAWERLGRPAFGAAWKLWEACHEWQQSWFNYPHVTSWLNDGRYKQEPPSAKPKAATVAPIRPADPYCGFHHQPKTRGKLPLSGPAFGCPECKHAEAASGERSGEPLALGGIR